MTDHAAPSATKAVFLSDYRPPDYRVDTVNLQFDLDEAGTIVKSLLTVSANYDRAGGVRPFVLDGRDLVLRALALDGRRLAPGEYTVDGDALTVLGLSPAANAAVLLVLAALVFPLYYFVSSLVLHARRRASRA